MHLRAVAEIEEARQRRGDDDGVAHDHVRLGRADLALRPGDRHHADRAVESGDIEADVGDAVGADLDHAGKQRERGLRRQIALEVAAAVAAAVQRAGGAFHAVDQEAVEVANVHAELALAEEITGRVGGLEAGQVQNADIDGGDRDLGLLSRRPIRRF